MDWIRPQGWTYLPESRKLIGLIEGETSQLCCIDLSASGRPISFACTCEDSRNYWGFCPHAVALLLTVSAHTSTNEFPKGTPEDLLRLRALYRQTLPPKSSAIRSEEQHAHFQEGETLLKALESQWETLTVGTDPTCPPPVSPPHAHPSASLLTQAPPVSFHLQVQTNGISTLHLPDALGLHVVDRANGILQYQNQLYQLPDVLLPCIPLYVLAERALLHTLALHEKQVYKLLPYLRPLQDSKRCTLSGLVLQTESPHLRLYLEKRAKNWMVSVQFCYRHGSIHPKLFPSDPPTSLLHPPETTPTDSFSIRDLKWEQHWISLLQVLPLRTSPFTSARTTTTAGPRETHHSFSTPVYWLDEEGLFQFTQSLLPLLPDPSCLETGPQTPRPQILPLTCTPLPESSPNTSTTNSDPARTQNSFLYASAENTPIPKSDLSFEPLSRFSQTALTLQTQKLTFSLPFSPKDWKAVQEALRIGKSHILLRDGVFLNWDLEDPNIKLLLQLIAIPGGKRVEEGLQFEGIHALQAASVSSLPPQHALRTLYETLCQASSKAHGLPPSLFQKLHPYQRTGVHWMQTLSKAGLGGILADDMGLGKTLQLLSYLTWRKDQTPREERKPALVIVPTALLYNWKQEAKIHTPQLRITLLQGNAQERLQILETNWNQTDVFLSTYAQIRRDAQNMCTYTFSTLVLDEAQAIKNNRTQTARAMKLLQGDRRFALTGTPIENRLSELWSLFDFLLPGYLPSSKSFHKQFVLPIEAGDSEVQARLKRWIAPFLLRRVKMEVLQELPPKIESDLFCPLTSGQEALYRKQFDLLRQSAQEWNQVWRSDPNNRQALASRRFAFLTLLMRLRQICCHPALFVPQYRGGSGKLDALAKIRDTALEGGHKLLIFSQFTRLLRLIQRDFKKEGLSTLYLDGTLSAEERSREVQRFQEGEADIFLLSLRAGGHGLNLTRADTVILLDPWWNPAVESQAADRAHRMGQKQPVQLYRLLTAGTIEESILQLQKQKRAIIDTFVGNRADGMRALSPEDWLQLLDEESDRLSLLPSD